MFSVWLHLNAQKQQVVVENWTNFIDLNKKTENIFVSANWATSCSLHRRTWESINFKCHICVPREWCENVWLRTTPVSSHTRCVDVTITSPSSRSRGSAGARSATPWTYAQVQYTLSVALLQDYVFVKVYLKSKLLQLFVQHNLGQLSILMWVPSSGCFYICIYQLLFTKSRQ